MKKMIAMCVLVITSIVCSGCNVYLLPHDKDKSSVSGYSYVPIDPFPVRTKGEKHAFSSDSDILKSLPDIAVRVSVRESTASGEVLFGQNSVGASGSKYRITVDYINADTVSKNIAIAKSIADVKGNVYFLPPFMDITVFFADSLLGKNGISGTNFAYKDETSVELGKFPIDLRTVRYYVFDTKNVSDKRITALLEQAQNVPFLEEYTIPLYVGIGMRVVVDISEVKSGVNITGLGTIGASAEAGLLNGSLAVQTLGVNGEAISAALPIQSELNRTTAQNAIMAIGSIKALLYNEETVKMPRVVGMYLPFPANRRLVNAIVSSVAETPPEWDPFATSREPNGQ